MIKTISIFTLIVILSGCGESVKNQTDSKSSFEKIIFHTTGCFGTCPTYHLQVDADKSLKLFAETVYRNEKRISTEQDTTKTGYFNGVVNDSTFALLNKALKTIGLDTLEFDDATCCDGSVKTIIVYYEGKRKFLRSMFPPEKAARLISILYDICEKSSLTKTSKKFDIENEKKQQ